MKTTLCVLCITLLLSSVNVRAQQAASSSTPVPVSSPAKHHTVHHGENTHAHKPHISHP